MAAHRVVFYVPRRYVAGWKLLVNGKRTAGMSDSTAVWELVKRLVESATMRANAALEGARVPARIPGKSKKEGAGQSEVSK